MKPLCRSLLLLLCLSHAIRFMSHFHCVRCRLQFDSLRLSSKAGTASR